MEIGQSVFKYFFFFFRVLSAKHSLQSISRNPSKFSFIGSFSGLIAVCIILSSWNASAQTGKKWVGTWSCAPYRAETNIPPSPGLSNNTLRQIVRVSIGGDTLRMKFSNITCASAVTINKVNIAVSPDGTKSTINASTIKDLKFNGNATVTINAGAEVYSDPVAFPLTPSMRLAITTYYGQCQTSADMTFHYGSRTNSYILAGDKTTSADFSGATTVERWYTIHTIDVLAQNSAAAVATTGNSITDGYGLSGGLQNRWTDMFSESLLKDQATAQIGVLNLGIGATLVTSAANGAQSGVDRFKHDVLGQSGVRWVIIFYGVNDIYAGKSANDITNGLKQMVADTRAKDTSIKVYGATITPFNGHSYYSNAREAVRSAVNKWIRTADNFDACIDFDKTIRNPSDTTRLQAAYSNDWLHPNAAGYKLLGESINHNLFIDQVNATERDVCKVNGVKEIHASSHGGMTTVTFELPRDAVVSLKVYSMLGREFSGFTGKNFSSGTHAMSFKSGSLAPGMYIYSLRVDKLSVNRKIMH